MRKHQHNPEEEKEEIEDQEQEKEIKTEGEVVELGISQKELDEIRNKAHEEAKKMRHKWRQKGAWLVCRSCPQQHAAWIGLKKRMVGENDDGSPILQNIDKN